MRVSWIHLVAVFACILGLAASAEHYRDYIVIGAGPAGLQIGYYLNQAQRNYFIFERGNGSGTFFKFYPRHNKLISINKRFTGKTNKEFNMRHDWNSLLSHDESLLFTQYSTEFFPPKDVLVKYLNDFQTKLGIDVQYNTDISDIQKEAGGLFTMRDQHGNSYKCKYLIVASGMWEPNNVNFRGKEYTDSYETMELNPTAYNAKSVLILGRGNTAFEVADSIYGNTNLVHMVARSRVRLSWSTHYVGDLRAVNNGLLDTYQLKSLDGLLEASIEDAKVVKKDGKLFIELDDDDREASTYANPALKEGYDNFDNFALRDGYDKIIRCLGFRFNDSLFNENFKPEHGSGRLKKFIKLKHNYESTSMENMYVIGVASHSLDFRQSSGGFIHGFRYTARMLHRLLEWKNHQKPWDAQSGPITELLPKIIQRINEASGLYQMFAFLADVMVINEAGTEFQYLEEVPVHLIHELPSLTGIKADRVIVMVMEYGANFSGPGKDIFRLDRAVGEPSQAFRSNFLHPIFYYYKHLPTAADMATCQHPKILPTPDWIHHVVEDFLTSWMGLKSHILPLRRFIEKATDSDIRNQYAESCFLKSLMYNELPLSCQNNYMNGDGLTGSMELLRAAEEEIVSVIPRTDI